MENSSNYKHPDENYSVEDLPGGLYYIDMGTAYIEKGYYEIVKFYNKTDIITEEKMLADIYNHLPNIECVAHVCHSMMVLKDFIEQVLSYMELLIDLCHKSDVNSVDTIKRMKRGWFGWILTKMFGVNDEAYAALNELQLQNNDLYKYTNESNNLFQMKLNEIQQVLKSKIKDVFKVISEDRQVIMSLINTTNLQEDHIESIHSELESYKIFQNTEFLDVKYKKILNAVNGGGLWYEHFSYKTIKKMIKKGNSLLQNQVNNYFSIYLTM